MKTPRNFKAELGNRYGRLIVTEREENGKNWQSRWLCKCDCGNTAVVYGANLRSGCTQSCGCLQVERTSVSNFKHGHAKKQKELTPEYIAWASMKARCYNSKQTGFKYWGGRGITVCRRWRNSFEDFLEDVGHKPSPKHSLDRIDNNGNYEPGNVRWATRLEQRANRRPHGGAQCG